MNEAIAKTQASVELRGRIDQGFLTHFRDENPDEIREILKDATPETYQAIAASLTHADSASMIKQALNKIPADIRDRHVAGIEQAAARFIKILMPYQVAAAKANAKGKAKNYVKNWLQRVRRRHAGFTQWVAQNS